MARITTRPTSTLKTVETGLSSLSKIGWCTVERVLRRSASSMNTLMHIKINYWIFGIKPREEKQLKKLVIIIRCLLFSLGAAGFSGFILPFLKRRILNIGNLAGLTVCTVILLYSLFLPRIHKFFRLFWEKTTGKIILSIFSVVFLFS